MKALTLKQPHAHRVAHGEKTIELRQWTTSYRGPLLICSSKRGVDDGATDSMPRGVAVCVVELCSIRPATNEDRRAACVVRDIDPSRDFAWEVRLVRRIEPFHVRGRLGLFDVDVDLHNLKEAT